eukprot:scaffold5793_cov67-Cylindrotheca_fusiformis.AAC.2
MECITRECLTLFFLSFSSFLGARRRNGAYQFLPETYPTLQGVGGVGSDDTHDGIQTKSLGGGEARNSTTKTVTGGRSLVSGVPMVDLEQQLVLGGRKLSLWELISGLAAASTLRKESFHDVKLGSEFERVWTTDPTDETSGSGAGVLVYWKMLRRDVVLSSYDHKGSTFSCAHQ